MVGFRWAKGLVVVPLALLVALAVSCSGDDDDDGGGGGNLPGLGALTKFASGKWRCDLAFPDLEVTGTVDAEVRLDGPANGTFTFDFNVADAPVVPEEFDFPPVSGDWEVDGRDLEVSAGAVDALSDYAIEGVALDTTGIAIQEDEPGAKLQRVDVKRTGNTVTFTWDNPDSGEGTLTCTKA